MVDSMDVGCWRHLLETLEVSDEQLLRPSLKTLLQLSLALENRCVTMRACHATPHVVCAIKNKGKTLCTCGASCCGRGSMVK